jgi:hypothetical protein
MASTIVKETASSATSLISVMRDATFDAIELVVDSLQYIVDIVPSITGMVIRNITDLIKMVGLVNLTMSGFMSEFLDSGISEITNILTQAFSVIGDLSEVASFLVSNALIPAMTALSGINEIVKAGIEALTKTQLPRLLDAMKFLQSSAQSQIFGDASIAIVSLTVGLFTKIFKKTIGGIVDGSIITGLIESVTGVIKSINLNVIGSFDFCGILVGIIEPGLELLSLPGGADLNKCVVNFVRLGLWWMTQGIVCKGKSPITDFTDCLLGQIGGVTIIPAYKLELSIKSLTFGLPSIPVPGLSEIFGLFDSLLEKLPKFAIGWTDISLNTIFSNLQGVLNFLFNDLKTIFKKEGGGLLVSFSPNPGTILLPQLLMYVILKIATSFFTKLLETIYGPNGFLLKALGVVTSWAGCVEFGCPCLPWVSYTTVAGIPLPKFYLRRISVKFCISDILGPISYLSGLIFNLAKIVIDKLFNLTDMVLAFIGFEPPNISTEMIEAAIGRALAQLSSQLNLPFYFST